ncbi:TFIIH complex cyclin Mcs2 [Schizosaccharomyces japonicus yFS275]|uniref:TFIIH complex cyclin Mcs2 n=1 Tax=Schizosaccharomyces japonicus (strain yFS275 / FY16936) TaxID=402676 RepID=B6K7A6_SCHJY|nr:TFIIH complex cyclin Mcs2 [Schizosaccharomyces japonicus yFS275]EEB09410.1 TFIIH complex cyclin Mcs2 [Schizosaccharomyces japonicus yFS275]
MADGGFKESTQCKDWIFTETTLREKRESVNQKASEKVRKHIAEEYRMQNKDASEDKLPVTLNADEELLLVVYYTCQLGTLAAAMNLPSHIRGYAVTYFKRFFLVNSIMEYNPKTIIFTALYAATKASDHYIPIDQFCKKIPNSTPQQILEFEFYLCQSLDWDLYVWLPFRPLQGFLLDCQKALPSFPHETLFKCHDQAKQFLSETLHSDLYFLYSPSIMALSAIYHVNQDLCTQYLEAKNLQKLMPKVKENEAQLLELQHAQTDINKAKEIGKKLYFCMDPYQRKNSAVYLKRKAEDEEQEMARQRRKIERQKSVPDRNPFA